MGSNDTFQRRTLGRRYYPAATVDLLLTEVAKGRSVVAICEDRQFPAASSFYSWCASDTGLQVQYERARAAGEAKRTTASSVKEQS